jgi:hypothetical protein
LFFYCSGGGGAPWFHFLGLGFKVTCVSPPKLGFFLGVLRWRIPHFQGFWIQWCNKLTIIYHHLKDMGGVKFQGGLERWGHEGSSIIEFESFELTYPPPFSSVLKLVMCLVLLKCVRCGRYRRFKVLGLHRHFDLIVFLILGFGGVEPPHFDVLWIQWCDKPTIIHHHLEDMGGFEF